MNKDYELNSANILNDSLHQSNLYSFYQLFDINEVQKIQDAFSKATGVASIITETDGTPITKPSGFSYLCNKIIRNTELGLKNCMKSDAIIGSPNCNGPTIHRCYSGGLLDAGASIMVGDIHIANWLIGQVFDDEIEIQEMLNYCTEIGADQDAFLDAITKLTRMPKERFENICEFLYLNANMLSSLAQKNVLQQDQIIKRVQSEKKYRLLFENSTETIIVVQDLLIKICNPMAINLTGYSTEDLTSLPFVKFIHPDDRQMVENNHMKRLKGEVANHRYEFRALKKDNDIIWVEINSIKIEWEGKPATLNFISNINERKLAEQSLMISEEKYRLITEFASDVIWILNLTKGRFTYVSPSIYQLRGLTPEEAMEESLEDSLTYESFVLTKDIIEECIKEFLLNPENPNNYVTEIQQPCKNGEIIWVEVSTKYRFNADGDIEVVGVSRNIEERKKAEQEIEYISYHNALTGLYNRRKFEIELENIDKDGICPVSILMGDVNGLKLVNDAFGHANGDCILKRIAQIIKQECGNEACVARHGGDEFAVILPNMTYEDATLIVKNIHKRCLEETTNELMLNISFGIGTKACENDDLQKCYHLAEERMYARKLLEAKSTRNAIVSNLRTVMEEKTGETQKHCERIANMAQKIGEEIGMQSFEIEYLMLLSLLHDIGKTGIPENILLKPGKLTDKEWGKMQKHSEIGFRIANTLPELVPIADGVLSHHERWDGTGYPQGLKGGDIPLMARIVAILDSYDAMTNDRPYRKALCKEETINELYRCSGTQFDPNITKIFIEKVLGKE